MRRSSKRNHPNIAPSTSPPFFGYPKDVRIGNRCRICRLTITLKATLSPPRLDSREGTIPQGLFSEYLGGPARQVSPVSVSTGYVSSIQTVSLYACVCSGCCVQAVCVCEYPLYQCPPTSLNSPNQQLNSHFPETGSDWNPLR